MIPETARVAGPAIRPLIEDVAMALLAESRKRRSRSLTLEDLAARFGPMPAARIRFEPPPGTATAADLERILSSEDRLYELVDGVLVEKVLGYEESVLAIRLSTALSNFVAPRKLGSVSGSDGPFRLKLRLVRLPDVAFVSRKRFPKGKRPRDSIARVIPNLAVEVLSVGNTAAEMQEKLREYFQAGVELVWFVDHRRRTCEVFHSPTKSTLLDETQTLTGGAVLPGFEIPLGELFSVFDD